MERRARDRRAPPYVRLTQASTHWPFRALQARCVPVTVIGGFAVAAHKVVRATRDLVSDRSWAAAERFVSALLDIDAQPLSDPSITWTPEVLVRPCAMTNVQVRGVPEDVHRRLKSQAALAGQSLNEFLLARMGAIARVPMVPELAARIRERAAYTGRRVPG